MSTPTPMFSLVHASARPYGWQAPYSQYVRLAKQSMHDMYEGWEYVLVCDARMAPYFRATLPADPEETRNGTIYTTATGGKIRLLVNDGDESYVAAANYGATMARGHILLMVTDDMFPPKHWDAKVLDAVQARGAGPRGGSVVWVTDQCFPHIMTMQIFTRSWFGTYGYVFKPEYGSMQGDHDFTLRAKRDGVVIDCRDNPDMQWRHEHHRNSLRPLDSIDEVNQGSDRYLQGWRQLAADWPDYMKQLPIDELYEAACVVPSDINEHLPTLKALAAGKRVLELGVRHGRSTLAFLSARPHYLVSVDIDWSNIDPQIAAAAEFSSIPWDCIKADSREPRGEFDGVFFDSLHTADHLRAEIAVHAPKAQEWLAFHDTRSDWEQGQDGGPGLKYPIEELLAAGEWKTAAKFENNNGLLIMERVHAVVDGRVLSEVFA